METHPQYLNRLRLGIPRALIEPCPKNIHYKRLLAEEEEEEVIMLRSRKVLDQLLLIIPLLKKHQHHQECRRITRMIAIQSNQVEEVMSQIIAPPYNQTDLNAHPLIKAL